MADQSKETTQGSPMKSLDSFIKRVLAYKPPKPARK